MKLRFKVTWILAFVAFVAQGFAKQVDTINVLSPSMNIHVRNVVILPEDYDRQQQFPVLYLLHGYGGNHKSWIQLHSELPELATRYGMIIVCPDGKNSWYWDSPVDPSMRYETYVSKELVAYMDSHYKTIRDKKGRAITGLSMGGHGGLWFGFRHPDIFGACGSTSGGVDIRPFPDNWEMKKALGVFHENRERWNEHTVINQLHRIQSYPPAIIIDCGTEDFFFEVNEKLHEKLLYYRIPHDYLIRPGGHNVAYWKNSIEYQLLFFQLFFKGTS
jgi:S-formylglutathione hydrolase FrmB